MSGLVVAMAAWSLSSPPLSTPDEILHIANIWCANEADGLECISKEPNDQGEIVGTHSFGVQRECYWRKPSTPAGCFNEVGQTGGYWLLQKGSYYHPGFPKTMNAFISGDGALSLLRMKLFNSLLFVVLVGVLLYFVSSALAKSALTALAVTLSPFGIWLIASINPSGWGITGLALAWAFAVAIYHTLLTHRKFGRVSIVPTSIVASALVLSLFLATQARRDVMAFTIVVIAVVMTVESIRTALDHASERLRLRLRRSRWISSLVAAAVVLWGIRYGSLLGFSYRGTLVSFNESGPSLSVWLTSWLTHFPAVFLDAYGSSGLGENDIKISQFVSIASLLVLGGVLSYATAKLSWLQLSSFAILGLAFAAIMWFASIELDLYNVPGRYVMPLFPVIIGTYVYYSKSEVQFFDVERTRYVAIGLLGFAHALGLYAVVERYSAGSSGGLRVIPVRFDEWWWEFLPIGPNGVVLLGSAGWVIFLVYAYRYLDERQRMAAVR